MKELYVTYDGIKIGKDSVQLAIRNGDESFKVGDWFGGREVLKIEAYGKELNECCSGLTAVVTMSDIPLFAISETSPELVQWLKELRNKKR
jgi:hypothetical protein